MPRAFQRSTRQKRKICIYSSGSVLAQRLLFRATPAGDLTGSIEGFFDTQAGAKTQSASYGKIAAEVGHMPDEFLFVSDAEREIDAASGARMEAILCIRDESAQRAGSVIHTFDEIFPD